MAIALVVAVGLRIVSTGHLWLDESLSTEIARRPLPQMFQSLRHDGSPPLYYLLLHGWIAVFGASQHAVRALSSVIALATLPLAWLVGRRLGGRRVAWPMLLLTAAAPYTIRYATEARMYALLLLLVFAGMLALTAALAEPSLGRLVPVTLLTAAVAYTHYWGLYLLLPVAGWLLLRRAWRPLLAMVAAAVLYLPWLPSLAFQLKHTGTPWASAPDLRIVPSTVIQWGGPGSTGPLLGIGLLILALLGLTAVRRGSGRSLELDLTGRPPMRVLGWLAVGPLLVAVVLGAVTHGGFSLRYTAVCLPFFLLLAARGVSVLPGRRTATVVLAGAVALGLAGGVQIAVAERTQAGSLAAAIRDQAQPGDVVAYCPDQLAPAMHRLLPSSLGLVEIAYADPEGPALVDWVDYAQRVQALAPSDFVAQVDAVAGPHRVWLVTQDGYRAWTGVCPLVSLGLTARRGEPTQPQDAATGTPEHATLLVFDHRLGVPR